MSSNLAVVCLAISAYCSKLAASGGRATAVSSNASVATTAGTISTIRMPKVASSSLSESSRALAAAFAAR